MKGKAGYIAPEVVVGRARDRRTDVFSMGVLLWNALTGRTLFDTDDLASTLTSLLRMDVPPPSTVGLCPPATFDDAILGALQRAAVDRHASALEMSLALEDALARYGARVEREPIGAWVAETFSEQLARRRRYAASRDVRRVPRPSNPTPAPGETDHGPPLSRSELVRKDPSLEPRGESREDVLRHSRHSRSRRIESTKAVADVPSGDIEAGRRRRAWTVAALLLMLGGAGLLVWWKQTHARRARELFAPPASVQL